MAERKKVFICSPFRGDMEGNARRAAGYCRATCESGFLPVAPHLLFPQFLNEGIEAERQAGLAMGMELLLCCAVMRCGCSGRPRKGWLRRSLLPQSMGSG